MFHTPPTNINKPQPSLGNTNLQNVLDSQL